MNTSTVNSIWKCLCFPFFLILLSVQFLGATPILNCNNLDVTIACQSSLNGLPTPSMVSTDCGSIADVRISFQDDRSGLSPCSHSGAIIRTWIAVDSCGDIASCNQVITLSNNSPVLNCNNLDVTISCKDDLFNLPRPVATDDCTPINNIQLTFADDERGLGDCGHQGFIIRTWTATDACGLTSTCVQTITITNEAPVLNCNNLDATISCGDSRGENNLPRPSVTDDCTNDNELTLTFVDDDSNLNNCMGFFTRTWTATDACGSTATCVQTISIVNETAISVSCTPDNFTMECNGLENNQSAAQAWNQANIAKLTVCSFSNCGGINVTSDYDFNNLSDLCGFTGVLIVNYTITDACGNMQAQNARMSIEDTSEPIVTCDPANEMHECNGLEGNKFAALSWNLANISVLVSCATDICGEITVTSDYYFNNLSDACGLTGALTVTYTISDECGNSVTKVATFTIIDTTVPTMILSSTNLVINCSDVPNVKQHIIDWNTKNTNDLMNVAFDNCGSTTVTSDFDASIISNDCQAQLETSITYTIADECDNQISRVWNYTIIDRSVDNPLCENIQIQSINNELSIRNITASNPIVKVFDANYDIVFNCSGDCPETVTIPSLNLGEIYHTDIQFYDEDWQFICEDKQDVEVIDGTEPCDTSICQGDIVLKTQAEVDAFCACEVIEGDLYIGETGAGNFPDTDVDNLANLSSLKIIKGSLVIGRTQLVNLVGLEKLETIETTFTTVFNPQLINFRGLSNLSIINDDLVSIQNPMLESFTGLDKLQRIADYIYIDGNMSLQSLEGLHQITSCGSFDLANCPSITSLEGLTNLKSVEQNFVVRQNELLENTSGIENLEETGTGLVFVRNPNLIRVNGLDNFKRVGGVLVIQENNKLESIAGLKSVELANRLVIRENPILSDCCAIAHLIDGDLENGQVLDLIEIEQNLLFCNAPEEILQSCQTPPCDTSVCQGNVILRTQEEVDAFCGCEVIEGDVFIGNTVGGDFPETDIISLSTFRNTRIISGSFVLGRTRLQNFRDLENLEVIEQTFTTVFNNQLENYLGLNNLKLVGELVAMTNPKLENFSGLDSLNSINNTIYINGNQTLNSLDGLNQLNTCGSFDLVKCPLIKSLEGLGNLKQVEGSFVVRDNPNFLSTQGIESLEEIGRELVLIRNPKLTSIIRMNNLERINGTLVIFENDLLKDISGLENILFANNLVLRNNSELRECCSIAHLIDSDNANGIINGTIEIIDNPQFCNSPEAILQNCQTPPLTCESIQILTENNQIVIQGLSTPNEIIKVFDKDFNIVYQCVANCEDTQMAGTFPIGDYTVDLQLYDENWELICAEQRGVTVTQGDSNPCDGINCETIAPILANIPADMTVECDAIPSEPINITATDNCDSDVAIQFDETRTDGSCADNYTLTRTWTAFDDCGNSATGRYVITIIDSTDPILANIPADITVACDAVPSDPTNIRAIDNCDDNVDIEFAEDRTNGACVDAYVLTRTWTATDNCGNSTQSIQVVTVLDVTAPVLSNIPADLTFNANDGFDTTFPTSTDNCDNEVELTVEDAINSSETEIIRTFTATDNCGNTSTAQQVITIIQDGINLCDSIQIMANGNNLILSNITAANAIVKVFDPNWQFVYECNATCENEIVIPVEGVGVYHTDIQFYDENWQYICADKQNIEINITGDSSCVTVDCEVEPPVLVNIPADRTVNCDAIPSIPNNITATDNCDDSVLIEFEEIKSESGCEDSYTLVRTWTATDDCGNISKRQQVISIQDNTPPVLQNIPNLIIYQNEEIPPVTATATDNCDVNPEIAMNERFNEQLGQITREFTVRDNCNNQTTERQVITIIKGETNLCPEVRLEGNNNISVSNVTAPQETLRIYDSERNLIYECTSCEDNFIVPVENAGVYDLNVLMYNSLGEFTCSLAKAVEVIKDDPIITDNCLVLKPSGSIGKDAMVWSRNPNSNFGVSYESLLAFVWVQSIRSTARSYLAFDFSDIPAGAKITTAELSLYYNTNENVSSFDTHVGDNQMTISRVLENWNESTITWQNQPNITSVNQKVLASSVSGTQNYLDIDVTGLVSDMLNSEEGNHGFRIKLLDETTLNKSLLFASSDNPDASLHPEIKICWEFPEELVDCNTASILVNENTLEISELGFPIQIVKIFDNNYATVYECFADCEERITIPDLAAGTYHVNINFYDENWEPICEKVETVEIEVNSQDRNTNLLPTDFTLYPNPAEEETFIDLGKLKGEPVQLTLYNQFGQAVYQRVIEKVETQKTKIDVANYQNGLYILKIKAKGKRPIAKKMIINRLY